MALNKSDFVPLGLIAAMLFVACHGQDVVLKWPDIENESGIDDYQKLIISLANVKLNITFLPKYALDDANDIITDLYENLQKCQNHLLNDHLLWHYKVCVFQQLDSTDNQIWDLKNSLRYDSSEIDDDDSQSSSLSIQLTLIISNLIILSYFLF